jgi:uncharacterized protein YbjT (DUF2867 family)
MYVITGATGNIGSKLTENLLMKGKSVRMIGRNKDRMQPWLDRGATDYAGTLDNWEFLTKAFTGATAVFTMIPPNMQTDNFKTYAATIGEAITTAIQKSGVKYVINLSSLGAHLPKGSGIVQNLYEQEQRLNRLTDVNVIHLRPTYFMENLLGTIDMIKNMNMISTPIKSDLKFPMVATSDVAEVATNYLLDLTWTGHMIHNILGPRDVTYDEVTRVLGTAIGHENLKYVEGTYDTARETLQNIGMSRNVSGSIVEMMECMNCGKFTEQAERTAETTTSTTIEDFSKTYATLYNQ